MKRKAVIYIVLIFVIIVIIIVCFGLRHNGDRQQHSLGRTPYSDHCTFGEGFVLYQDYVSKNDEEVFSGLYLCELNEANESKENISGNKLLSDSFYSCANIYHDSILMINTDYNIEQINIEGTSDGIIYDNHGNVICDALRIDDYLYFIAENDESTTDLLAINLKDSTQKKIVENINPHYLYHYNNEKIAVISRDNEAVMVCNFTEGVVNEYPNPVDEILGFLDDGSVILSKNRTDIYQLNNLQDGKETNLLKKDNIFRVIMHTDEMLISTMDDYGLIEIFIYNFSTGETVKIANANIAPVDFNEKYVICNFCDAPVTTELINRET